ncbi:Soluble calcium-activated nucleotidase 1 [Balamuthia mandrillaris]
MKAEEEESSRPQKQKQQRAKRRSRGHHATTTTTTAAAACATTYCSSTANIRPAQRTHDGPGVMWRWPSLAVAASLLFLLGALLATHLPFFAARNNHSCSCQREEQDPSTEEELWAFTLPDEHEQEQKEEEEPGVTEEGQNRPMPQQYPFAIVTDLDKLSRDPQEFVWHAFMKKGLLIRNARANFTIQWEDTIRLTSSTAHKNRSMELSELAKFKGKLLAMCDYTGIVYQISDSRMFQRHALADGNGKEPKPFKTEWATVKDDLLYLGSIGKEWVVDGKMVHYNPQWVKTVDKNGHINNYDWGANYQALRQHTNTTYPGYLSHEAVEWHPGLRKWLFLPRKASENISYDEATDERMATNLLLMASEDFSQVESVRVGPLLPEAGFTSMKLVPDTNEIIALRAMEVGSTTKTWITVFDRQGNFRLEPSWQQLVSPDTKYEGLAFL